MLRPPRPRSVPLAPFRLIVAALLTAAPGLAQPGVHVGSSSEGDIRNEWAFGLGYHFDFPVLPFEVVLFGQAGIGVMEDAGRQIPVRAYLTARVGALPTPGFRAYVGGGAGVATRFGGESDGSRLPSGVVVAGIGGGRLYLEVQFQRDFAEEPVTRWVTALGLSF